MMKTPSENEALDWLLRCLWQKGPTGFNVYFDLEERYGKSFAEEQFGDLENTLEFHQLAYRDPSDMIFRLSWKGEFVSRLGGWSQYSHACAKAEHEKHLQEQAKVEQQKRNQDLWSDDNVEVAAIDINPSSVGLMMSDLAVILLIAFMIILVLMYCDIHN